MGQSRHEAGSRRDAAPCSTQKLNKFEELRAVQRGPACATEGRAETCAMFDKTLRECLTFDDVMLVPAYSEVLPADVDVKTRL